MMLRSTFGTVLALVLATGGAAAGEAPGESVPAPGAEQSFLAENGAAMAGMMSGMAAEPTGDVDRDFVAVMAPHHQGAIDMAMAELRYGRNERLRRMAQEIIVTQQQEIAAMRSALGDPSRPSVPSPTEPPRSEAHDPAPAPGHAMRMRQDPRS